jgi:hypothetical protein
VAYKFHGFFHIAPMLYRYLEAIIDSFENFRENSLKGDLSNNITLNPPLFSLVNSFNKTETDVLNMQLLVTFAINCDKKETLQLLCSMVYGLPH